MLITHDVFPALTTHRNPMWLVKQQLGFLRFYTDHTICLASPTMRDSFSGGTQPASTSGHETLVMTGARAWGASVMNFSVPIWRSMPGLLRFSLSRHRD